MPLYEYECAQCHRRTEKIQKFSDAALTVCPHCGGALAKTITAPAFHFAGGGWYKDGYGSAKPGGTGTDASASGASAPSSTAETSGTAQNSAAAPAATAAPATSSPAAAPAATSSASKT